METALLTGLGLAAPAGLNAYLPLLIVGLAARFTDVIELSSPFTVLSSGWGLVVLTILLTIEIVLDKIPGVDHFNDIPQTFVRPFAGAVLIIVSSNVDGAIDGVLVGLLGAGVAGGIHTLKVIARPAVTVTTGGLGNPLLSVAEDAIAGVVAILALLTPLAIIVILPLLLVMLTVGFRIVRRRARLQPKATPPNLRR